MKYFCIFCLENHAESLLPSTNPELCEGTVASFCWVQRLTDNFLFGGGFISKAGSNGNWLRLDLGVTLSVGKIMLGYDVPSTYKDQIVDFEISVGKYAYIFRIFTIFCDQTMCNFSNFRMLFVAGGEVPKEPRHPPILDKKVHKRGWDAKDDVRTLLSPPLPSSYASLLHRQMSLFLLRSTF